MGTTVRTLPGGVVEVECGDCGETVSYQAEAGKTVAPQTALLRHRAEAHSSLQATVVE